jgi:hypothetical protein
MQLHRTAQQARPRPDRPAVARLARPPRSAPQIRSSGLWNVNHVTEHHDPRVLDELANAIAAAVQAPAI